jgi:large subunit ribosomal protein L11
VIITAYSDRTFTFITKTRRRRSSEEGVGVTLGLQAPEHEKVGKVTRQQLEDIAKAKNPT